jgi:transposase
VVVLNPIQTNAMREMLMEENKTDEIDTLVIAETIRFGRYKASSVPQEKLLALRELCRNRFYLIDMGSDLKRKITALLDQVFPEFESQTAQGACQGQFRYPGLRRRLLRTAPAVPGAVPVSSERGRRIGEKNCGTVLSV